MTLLPKGRTVAARLGDLIWSRIAQDVHKLPDLMALAFHFLGRFSGDLIAALDLRLGLGDVSNLAICLSQSVVRLLHLRIGLNGLPEFGNRSRIIFLDRMDYSELEISGGERGIELDRMVQQGFDLCGAPAGSGDSARSFQRPAA